MAPVALPINNRSVAIQFISPKRYIWRLVIEKIPLFGLSVVSAVITMQAQQEGGAVRTSFSFWTRLGNAVISYVAYLVKLIAPVRLAALYPYPGNSLSGWAVVASGLLLIAITITVIKFKKFRYLIVGWLWYLGILVPMIGLVQVGEQSMADRYTYISGIGLFVIVAWGAADWASAKQVSASILATSGLLMLVALSTLTHFQEGYWHDNASLWTHAIKVTRPNFVAEDNLGGAFVQQHQYGEAILHFRKAAEINPNDAFSELNIGVFEASHGNTKEAIARYKFALNKTADARLRASALSNLGSAYRSLGDYPNARESYESARKLRPNDAFNLIGLGITNQKTGNLDHAIEYYSRALKAQTTDVGFLLLAQSLEKSGRITEAQTAFARAQEISNNLDSARQKTKQLLSDQVPEPVAASELKD
jgi:Flp pilus assembly protein TadD